MQTVLTYLTLLFTGVMLTAQSSITVTITNLDSNDGKLMVALYNSEDNFLGEPEIGSIQSISNNTATVIFYDVPAGEYAVSAFHDENENQELDMILGMFPKEDYVHSNYASGKFGPPEWADAKFTLKNEPLNFNLKMNN